MNRLALETELKTEILNIVLDSDGDLKKMNLDKVVQISIKLNEMKDKPDASNDLPRFAKMTERDVFEFETEQDEIRSRMNRLRN